MGFARKFSRAKELERTDVPISDSEWEALERVAVEYGIRANTLITRLMRGQFSLEQRFKIADQLGMEMPRCLRRFLRVV